MSVYPEQIRTILADAHSPGPVDHDAIEGADASFECGCYVRVSLVMGAGDRIESARYRSNGCGYMCAAATVLCRSVETKGLADLHGLEHRMIQQILDPKLGRIPETRNSCVAGAIGALRAAFAELRRRRVEEFAGEKALICTCFGVSEETITVFLRQNPDADLHQVIDGCRAGSGCGSCRSLITELIDLSRPSADLEADLPFRSL